MAALENIYYFNVKSSHYMFGIGKPTVHRWLKKENCRMEEGAHSVRKRNLYRSDIIHFTTEHIIENI